MREIYFGNFRLIVIQQIREIQEQEPEHQSIEWYLLKYLRRIEKNANPPSTPGNMENSVRALVRYYVDQVEEHSDLGERCRFVYEQYRKTLREAKEGK